MEESYFTNAHEGICFQWAQMLPRSSEVIGEKKTHVKQCDWRFKISDGRLAQIECKASVKLVPSDFVDAFGFERREWKSMDGSPEGRWLYNQIKEASEQLDPSLGPTILLIPACSGDLVYDECDVMQALTGVVGIRLPNRTPVFDAKKFGSSRPQFNQGISAIGIIRLDFPKNQSEMVGRILEGNESEDDPALECIPVVDIFKNPHAIVEWPDKLCTENDQVYVWPIQIEGKGRQD